MTTITLQETPPPLQQGDMPDFTGIPIKVITGQTTERASPSVNETVASTAQLAEAAGHIAVPGAGVETQVDPQAAARAALKEKMDKNKLYAEKIMGRVGVIESMAWFTERK